MLTFSEFLAIPWSEAEGLLPTSPAKSHTETRQPLRLILVLPDIKNPQTENLKFFVDACRSVLQKRQVSCSDSVDGDSPIISGWCSGSALDLVQTASEIHQAFEDPDNEVEGKARISFSQDAYSAVKLMAQMGQERTILHPELWEELAQDEAATATGLGASAPKAEEIRSKISSMVNGELCLIQLRLACGRKQPQTAESH